MTERTSKPPRSAPRKPAGPPDRRPRGGRPPQRGRPRHGPPPDVRKAVRRRIDAAYLKAAEAFEGGGATTSQVRRFYGAVTRMMEHDAWEEPDLLLLKARIDYAARRPEGLRQSMARALTGGIDTVLEAESAEERKTRFRRFHEAFEAIVAYCRRG